MAVNPIRAFALRFGGELWFTAAAKRFIGLDGAIQQRTRARFGLLSLAGVDGLLLTTTGRRSGSRRTVPLLYVPTADGYLVAGSNWGGELHPAWSGNLLAEPAATVAVGGRVERVSARLVEGAERDRLWPLLTRAWPGYRGYARRAGREIRVFVLGPAE
jgi:deazaflavin-dependent oxidoreductase (nitroreductase family)